MSETSSRIAVVRQAQGPTDTRHVDQQHVAGQGNRQRPVGQGKEQAKQEHAQQQVSSTGHRHPQDRGQEQTEQGDAQQQVPAAGYDHLVPQGQAPQREEYHTVHAANEEALLELQVAMGVFGESAKQKDGQQQLQGAKHRQPVPQADAPQPKKYYAVHAANEVALLELQIAMGVFD